MGEAQSDIYARNIQASSLEALALATYLSSDLKYNEPHRGLLSLGSKFWNRQLTASQTAQNQAIERLSQHGGPLDCYDRTAVCS